MRYAYVLFFVYVRSEVSVEVIETERIFEIAYALNEPGNYDMDIKFGGKKIPDGEFTIKVHKMFH